MLSIQDWGAIGEIVGAVGVIVTLLFLSLQIRANTKESRLSATADIARDYNAYLQHITSNEALSALWLRAVDDDFGSLTEAERARVIMVMGNFFRIMESAHIQYTSGRMDLASWQGYERLLARSVSANAFSAYWQLRATLHGVSFQKLIEKISQQPDQTPMFTPQQ